MNTKAATRASLTVSDSDISESRIGSSVKDQGQTESYDDFFPLPELINEEIAIVQGLQLSPHLQHWVDAYAHCGERNLFLWKWCRRGVEVTTLPCVANDLLEEVYDTKVLGVMLDVLLDDVADEGQESDFLEHLLSIPFGTGLSNANRFSVQQQAYAELTQEVWSEIQRRIQRFPHFSDHAELLNFDYRQLFNTMRYSQLLNSNPVLLNLAEHDLYLPHNMHMIISSTMDLMCSPDFDCNELGRLREAMWKVQYMGRVGNLVTTWQREIGERDFTSGVFAHAVSIGKLSATDLIQPDPEMLELTIQNGDHESFFLRRWQTYRRELVSMADSITSVDLVELVHGLERLICLHLASRGRK